MTSHQSIIFALTGGIACGKSEAGRILTEEGFAVLDTDTLAHDLMKSGSAVFDDVVERFGREIVGADGELDRAVLGKFVFDNPAALEDLNRMVHPAVREAVEQWKVEQTGDAVVMIPLLFEAGWTEGWDAIVCISADEDQVFQRLEKRGLSGDEARKRIAAQMPLNEKEKKSDFILKNNETLDALRNETHRVLEAVRRGKDHE